MTIKEQKKDHKKKNKKKHLFHYYLNTGQLPIFHAENIKLPN